MKKPKSTREVKVSIRNGDLFISPDGQWITFPDQSENRWPAKFVLALEPVVKYNTALIPIRTQRASLMRAKSEIDNLIAQLDAQLNAVAPNQPKLPAVLAKHFPVSFSAGSIGIGCQSFSFGDAEVVIKAVQQIQAATKKPNAKPNKTRK